MRESEFAKAHKSLLAHLKCDVHSNERYCWRPGGEPYRGKVHICLNAQDLEQWAMGIKNSTATKFHPPESEYFWKLKAKYNPENPQRGTRRPQTPDTRHHQEQRIRFEFAPAPQFMPAYSTTDQTSRGPRQRSNSIDTATSSPIKGFHPRDYNGAGLQAFLSWMTSYYEDGDYLELFPVLQAEKLGIDLFKKALHNSMQANKLEHKLEKANVKCGMIDRLMMDFENWYTEYVKDL